MRKMLSMGAWYISFVIVLAFIFWHMPEDWRFCDALAKPVLIRPQTSDTPMDVESFKRLGSFHRQPLRSNGYYLLGDCTMQYCTRPYARYTRTRSVCSDISQWVDDIRCATPDTIEAHFVLASGRTDIFRLKKTPEMLVRDMEAAKAKLLARFPKSKVTVIQPYDILTIAKKKRSSKDKWHLTDKGWKELLTLYPEIADF